MSLGHVISLTIDVLFPREKTHKIKCEGKRKGS